MQTFVRQAQIASVLIFTGADVMALRTQPWDISRGIRVWGSTGTDTRSVPTRGSRYCLIIRAIVVLDDPGTRVFPSEMPLTV